MTTKHATTSAAIYVRRSSSKDAGLNHSLVEQETACRELAARLRLDVVRVYEEREGTGASARSRKARPQWTAALDDLDAGDDFTTLLVYALDRADRRGADTMAALLTKHAATGRRIVSADGLDTGDERQRLSIIIKAEIAREEAENIARRVSRTKAARRTAGSWLGGKAPYGLRIVEGKLDHDPATYGVSRRIAEEALAGASLWKIVTGLNADGVPSPTGTTWRTNTISQLLRAPGFAGLQSIRGRTASGGWKDVAEVYIDPDTRRPVSVGRGVITPQERSLILAQLASRTVETHKGTSGRRSSATLTGGLLRCTGCGARASSSSSGTAGSYRCGALANGQPCPAPFSAPRPHIDEYLTARFLSRVAAMEPDDEQLLAIAERWAGRRDPASVEERNAAEAAVEARREDLARTRRLAVSGILTDDEAAEEMPRLRRLLAEAEAELAALPAAVIDVGPLLDLTQSRAAFDDLSLDDRRALLSMSIDYVDAKRASGRGVRFKAEERLVIHWRE